MNLKHIGMGLAVIAASAAIAVPAQAAKITTGSTLTLVPNGTNAGALLINPLANGNLKLDFFGARGSGANVGNPIVGNQGVTPTSGTGSFTGSNTTPITRIADLELNKTFNPNKFVLGSLPDFLTGIDVTDPASNRKFSLTSFRYDAATGIGKFAGTFDDGFSTLGLGTFTLDLAGIPNGQFTGNIPNDFRYSLSVTAVPTPALLPGLVAMGAAAFRRRKAAAKTAEV
jgi:hypothetical protein